jgi:hypothetical protein
MTVKTSFSNFKSTKRKLTQPSLSHNLTFLSLSLSLYKNLERETTIINNNISRSHQIQWLTTKIKSLWSTLSFLEEQLSSLNSLNSVVTLTQSLFNVFRNFLLLITSSHMNVMITLSTILLIMVTVSTFFPSQYTCVVFL